MRILIVAATQPEVDPLMQTLGMQKSDEEENLFVTRHPSVANCSVLVTGAGMVPTAFALGRHLPHNVYNLVVNLGVAGSFDRNIKLGEVLEITKDTFAELGAEDDTRFINIEQLGLGASIFNPTSSLGHFTGKINLPKATAITVNTVHGNDNTIAGVVSRVNPQLESMEGAAFFFACRQLKVPCVQIRAVSNYVEKRNRDNWQIGLAVKNLNTFALDLIREL
ncbi:futalosine hydrolase [Mucilaginibacter sp. UR6-11]|uniref:futalosine hydrolase n=1 Tax=Mucilaginibacter sp. UR6-11 TaxID=1435644 RepID=UPI001E6433B9|nr:futalosine hydrolase [Mucilaginibacter sp. UR6-11]MCC8425631.1 futalosine hydrolase [Mucilaginibacter sp. UR6-11]